METKEIERVLIEEVSDILDVDPSAVPPERPLQELGLDSMSLMEILVFIGNKFQLQLMQSGLREGDFQSVQALSRCVARELSNVRH